MIQSVKNNRGTKIGFGVKGKQTNALYNLSLFSQTFISLFGSQEKVWADAVSFPGKLHFFFSTYII